MALELFVKALRCAIAPEFTINVSYDNKKSVMVSVPLSTVMVLRPDPPEIVSLPSPPVIVSLYPPPTMESAPLEPVILCVPPASMPSIYKVPLLVTAA